MHVQSIAELVQIGDAVTLVLLADLGGREQQPANCQRVLLALGKDRDNRVSRQLRLGQRAARRRQAGAHHVGAAQHKLDRAAVDLHARKQACLARW